MGGIHPLYADLWDAALQTAESIRTGQPQAKHDYTQMSREALETFYQGLHPGALTTGRTLAKDYGLSSCQRLLDVGGGSGGVAIAVADSLPPYPSSRCGCIECDTDYATFRNRSRCV